MEQLAHTIGHYFAEKLPHGAEDLERALQLQFELGRQGISKLLGQILVEQGLLDNDQIEECLRKQKQDVLASMALFESVPPESLAVIAMMAPGKIFSPGNTIFHYGDAGDTYYIVISGELLVYRTADDGSKVPLAILKSGERFGELSFLSGETRKASVEAIRTSNVLELPRKLFDDIILSNPRISRSFARVMAERLSSGNLRFLESSTLERAYGEFIQEC